MEIQNNCCQIVCQNLDLIPVVSTLVNLFHLFVKTVILCYNLDVGRNSYFEYVNNKNSCSYILSLIPIIGNLFLLILYLKKPIAPPLPINLPINAGPPMLRPRIEPHFLGRYDVHGLSQQLDELLQNISGTYILISLRSNQEALALNIDGKGYFIPLFPKLFREQNGNMKNSYACIWASPGNRLNIQDFNENFKCISIENNLEFLIDENEEFKKIIDYLVNTWWWENDGVNQLR